MVTAANLSLFLFILAVFLAPLIGGRFDFTSSAALYIMILLSFLALHVSSGSSGPAAWRRNPEYLLLGLFLAVSAVAGLFTVGAHVTMLRLFALAACYVAFLLAGRLAGSGREWLPVGALAAAGVWLGLSAILERRALIAAGFAADSRVFGSYLTPGFFNPGFFAGFLALALPVSLGLYCGSRNKWLTLLAAAAWLLQLSALLATGTRLGAAAAFLGLLCFLALLAVGKSLSRQAVIRLAPLAVLSVVPLILFSVSVAHRAGAVQSEGYSWAFRTLTWRATLDMALANPIVGVGPGAFSLVFPQYEIAGFTRMAHNAYLQIAAETGVTSLILLVAGIYAALVAAVRGLRAHRPLERAESVVAPIPLLAGLIAGALACLARNLTDSDWYIPAIGLVFWMTLGLAAGIGRNLIAPETAVSAPGKRLSLVVVVVTLLLIAAIAVTDIAAYYAQKGDVVVENEGGAGLVAACSDYRTASKLAPLSAEYHLKCAKADMASLCKPWESAEREVRVAARLEPTNPTPYMILAHIKLVAGSKRDALAACRQAEKRDPRSPSVKIAVADILQALGKRDEALQVYRQVLDIEKTPYEQVRAIPELVDPNYAFAHFELGKVYEERGKTRQAVEEYRAAVKRIERRNSFKTMLEIERMAGGDPSLNRRANEVLAESRSRLARLGY